MSSSFQLIKFHSVYKSYGPKAVLTNCNLVISRGQKLALIGENGCGKTTLAKLAMGLERADSGDIAVSGRIGYLPQETSDQGETVGAYLMQAQGHLAKMAVRLRELEEQQAWEEWDELHHLFVEAGGYEAAQRSERCLSALGLDQLSLERPLKSLSGGELRRVTLAALLLHEHDFLILDEPTNHLDQKALNWLEDYLRKYSGAVLLISHHRDFLNRVADGILELTSETKYYSGNYDDYLVHKKKEFEQALSQYERMKEDKEELQSLIKEQTFSPRKVGALKDRNKMAYDHRGERHLQAKKRIISQAKARLEAIELSNPMPKGYTGIIFRPKPVEFALHLNGERLKAGDRLILSGPNGSGKSTLLRQLAKEYSTLAGYLPQEAELEDLDLNLLEYLAKRFPLPEHELRSRLHRLGLIEPQLIRKKVGMLNLGQKRRLQLLEIMLSGANLLLLDEPTNHLAPKIIDELEEALIHFPGIVIAATHDARFARKVGNRFFQGR